MFLQKNEVVRTHSSYDLKSKNLVKSCLLQIDFHVWFLLYPRE